MPFNTDKCKVIHTGHGNKEHLNDVGIVGSDVEKDLGVWMSKDLKSSTQCSNVAKKANQMLGMIKRTIMQKVKEVILPLYKALVRPHLDYCVPVW